MRLRANERRPLTTPRKADAIRLIGVQFHTGDPYEGDTFSGPTETVLHIDAIAAQLR